MIIIPIPIGTENSLVPSKYSSRLKVRKVPTISLAIFLNTACSFWLSFLFSESIGLHAKICRAFTAATQRKSTYVPEELINLISAKHDDKSSVEKTKQTTEEKVENTEVYKTNQC